MELTIKDTLIETKSYLHIFSIRDSCAAGKESALHGSSLTSTWPTLLDGSIFGKPSVLALGSMGDWVGVKVPWPGLV